MKVRHRRFIEEFCKCGDKARAAINAGYAVDSAKQTGYRLYNTPEIRIEIDKLLADMSMSAEEAIKHNSDIAKTRLNDYLEVREVMRTPTVRKGLAVLIEELKAEIQFEQDYHDLAEVDEHDLERLERKQKERRNQIVRYTLELSKNPDAYRDVDGEPVPVEEVQINLVALARDKTLGRIKSLSFSEFGPKVEMYPADKALETVLKLHGKLVNKVDHTSGGKSFGDFLMESSDE